MGNTTMRVIKAIGSGVAMVATLGSVYIGLSRSVAGTAGFGSKDLQWSPARALLRGDNPYVAYLHDSPDIILTQAPNYLHLLYFALVPLGALPFGTAALVWCSFNIGLGIGLAVFYSRLANLGWFGTTFLGSALLCSTPFRLGLSNGQHAILILTCGTVAFVAASRQWAGASLALALTKYSFAPLALVLLAKRQWKPVAVAAGVLLCAAAAFSVVTDTPIADAISQPFAVSKQTVGPGAADVMTALVFATGLHHSDVVVTGAGVVAALVLVAVAAKALHRGDWVFALGIGAMISLLSFKHLGHDLVFLLPVVVLALRMRAIKAAVALALIAYEWVAVGVLSQIGYPINSPWVFAVSFTALLALFIIVVIDEDARGVAMSENLSAAPDTSVA